MIWNKTEVFVTDEWVDVSEYPDINIDIDKDGRVLIRAKKIPLKYVRLISKTDIKEDEILVLSDAWERAYGDLSWCVPEYEKLMPWYFAASCSGKVYCFGVKTQPNSLCSWQIGSGRIVLNIDVRNGSSGIDLKGRTLEACTVIEQEYSCDEFSALQDFCGKMCDNPRLPKNPVYGGNDWYCNYGDNSFEKIITHTKRIVECSPKSGQQPYMVIDDGWELCHHDNGSDVFFNGGPWRYCNANFGDMKKLADEIKALGAIPGIWFRPLWTIEKVPDEAVLRNDGIKVTLDPSSEVALKIISEDILTLKSWGYRLIKHDFSTFDIFGKWGFETNKSEAEMNFSDKTKTTAEIIKNLYHVIRSAAGDDVLIMGCNTISHLSAGIFEIQRTGDDTSGKEWARTKKYGINTLAFRMPQHNKFYCADADCVGITRQIAWETNRQWLDVLSKSGTAVFVSIAENAYDDEIKKDITAAFEKAAVNTEPSFALDWKQNSVPKQWKSKYGTDEYNWE